MNHRAFEKMKITSSSKGFGENVNRMNNSKGIKYMSESRDIGEKSVNGQMNWEIQWGCILCTFNLGEFN